MASSSMEYASLPLSLDYQSVIGDTANATSYTFGSQSFGSVIAGGNTRYILACILGAANAAAGEVSTCTIGGNSATRIATTGSVGRPIAIFALNNNALTSGVVAATFEQTQVHAASAVFQLVNPASTTPTDSRTASVSATSVNTTLTIPSGGVGIALSSPNVDSGTLSWTNATEAFELNVDGGSNTYVGGAKRTTAGLVTITVTQVQSGNVIQIFVAAWS